MEISAIIRGKMDFNALALARSRHRHFVAVPLAFFLLLISVIGVRSALFSGALNTISQEDIVSQATGEQVRLSAGFSARLNGDDAALVPGELPELQNGSALFKADGVMRLKAGPFLLTGIAGGWYVSWAHDKLTVVSLTSPLLVSSGSGKVVVPVGSQWEAPEGSIPAIEADPDRWMEAQEVRQLPASFLQKQLPLLSGLHASFLPPERADEPSLYPPVWLLPHTRDRMERMRIVGFLRSLVARKDWDGLDRFMRKDGVLQAVQDSPGDIVELLTLAGSERIAVLSLFPAFRQDPDIRLLTSIHPKFREISWTAQDAESGTTVLQLLSVPASDTLYEATSDGLTERWQNAAAGLLAAQEDPVATLEVLLKGIKPSLSRFQKSGHLERLSRYASAFKTLAEPFIDMLSDDQTVLLRSITNRADVEPPTVKDQVVSSEEAASSSIARLSADEITARTYAAFRDAHALFTVQTTIRASEDGTADVRNIVFSGPKRDATFDCTYDPQNGEVRDISKDGKRLPFSLPFDRFVEWARGK